MTTLALLMIGAYLTFGRPFSYLGVLPFYPSEVYCVLALFLMPGDWLRKMIVQLLSFRPIVWWFVLFAIWGGAEVFLGINADYDRIVALKEAACHYYLVFFFIGEALGTTYKASYLARFFLITGIAAGLNGLLFAVYTSNIDWVLPWAPEVPVFDVPGMISYLIVGLMAFVEVLGGAGFIAIILDLLAALANPGRAMWLSIILGCGVVLFLQRGSRALFKVGAIILVIALVTVSAGALIPAAKGRGGSLSPGWIAAQIIATFSPNEAYDLVQQDAADEDTDADAVFGRAGTVDWRFNLWSGVIDSLETPTMWLVGHGYGLELPSIILGDEGLRSPHNFVIYLLGYTGLIGISLYLAFSISLVLLFYRLPASIYRTFLLAAVVATWAVALFGNGLETPFVAVPFYLGSGVIYGVAVGAAGPVRRLA
ncbi:MAG: O-antigen ligase family protein [Azospirillaceae bacterium]|nr:O-antigen ligase family protein [Azospirillaceae bacterium]